MWLFEYDDKIDYPLYIFTESNFFIDLFRLSMKYNN